MAAEVKTNFEGKWTLYKSEKFEEYLDAAGVNFIKKKAILSLTPSMKISVDGETITVTITMGPKTNKVSFKLGDEYEAQGITDARGVTTLSEGKLHTAMTPKDSKEKPQTVVREIVGGELVQTMTVGDVTAKRFFKKA